jgi:hypothetical protein
MIEEVIEVDPLTCPTNQGQMRILAFDQGRRGDREDPKASWPLGLKGQVSTQMIKFRFLPPSFYSDPEHFMDSYRI